MKISRNAQLWILFAAALAIRLVFVLTLKHEFYFDDEHEYYRMIENFLAGHGLAVASYRMAFRPPLLSLLATVFYTSGLGLVGFRVFQALLSAFTVVLIYLVGERVFSREVGLGAGIISVVYPFFIFYTGFLLTETLFVFLVVAGMYYLCRAASEECMCVAVKAGVLFGLAGLTRPTIQLYVPLAGILLLFFRGRLAPKLVRVIVLGACCLAVSSPWIIRNYVVFHHFVPGTTMGGRFLWEGNNPYSDGGPCGYFPGESPDIPELQRDRMFYRMTKEVIAENPRRFLWLLQNKFLRFWNVAPNAAGFSSGLYRLASVGSFGLLLPFFVLGLCLSLRNRAALFFHVLIVFFTVFHMVFLASIRYRLVIEPFYIILAVYGFLWLWDQMAKLKVKS